MVARIVTFFILTLASLLIIVLPAGAQDVPIQRYYWDGQSKFTVLVAGIDRRPGGQHGLAYLTDFMVLVNIDPQNKRIGVLRIPRDLFLPRLDNNEMERVNTLLAAGENMQPGTGPYLLMNTLQYNFGIFIDAFVIVDFDAVIALIDILGGITVDVPYTISDAQFPDMNYGYDPLYLQPGQHTLNGYQALQYARTRHQDSDFLRGERQIQVLMAIRDKIMQSRDMTSLLARGANMLTELEGHVVTDLTLREILFIAQTAIEIPRENIHMGSIGEDYVMRYPIRNQSYAYILDREKLNDLMTAIFGDNYWQ